MIRLAATSVGLGAICAIVSCGPAPAPTPATAAPSPTESAVLTDGLGRRISLTAPARRIVSLAPSNTEILFAIGAGERLIGRDDFSDYPPQVKAVKSIGGLYPKVNSEAIVVLEPDLVLAAGLTIPDDVAALSRLGLAVYSTSSPASLDDIYRDILAVGELTATTPQSSRLVADLKARAARVTAKTSRIAQKPRVFYEIDASDPARPWTAGPDSFVDEILSLAGAVNVAAGGQKYFQISLEALIAADPEVIILGSSTYAGQTLELVKIRAGWSEIAAVRSGTVYEFDDRLLSRPGPRVVEGLETLARLFHPGNFR